MFCPNCGRDCADANFCSQCGRKLKQTIQEEGAPDPHCGAQPTVDKPERERKKYSGIPYGTYVGYQGYIRLEEDALTIKNEFTEPCTVPYEKINEVYYFRGKFLGFPRITIRWEGNKDRPLPFNSYLGPYYDDTTVYHYFRDKYIFLHIFRTLKDIAEKNKADSK